jgi:malonyl CoA-acyl carrier protein transacylase
MTIKIKLSDDGGTATCWVADNEEDSFAITGRADSVDALARVLRSATAEHEFAQRGAKREPFVSDLTKVESEAAEKAAAKAAAVSAAEAAAADVAAQEAKFKAAAAKLADILSAS